MKDSIHSTFFISFNEIYFVVAVVFDRMLGRVIILLDDEGRAVRYLFVVFVSVIRKYVCRNNLEVHPVYAKCNKLTFLRFVTLETSLEQHGMLTNCKIDWFRVKLLHFVFQLTFLCRS